MNTHSCQSRSHKKEVGLTRCQRLRWRRFGEMCDFSSAFFRFLGSFLSITILGQLYVAVCRGSTTHAQSEHFRNTSSPRVYGAPKKCQRSFVASESSGSRSAGLSATASSTSFRNPEVALESGRRSSSLLPVTGRRLRADFFFGFGFPAA